MKDTHSLFLASPEHAQTVDAKVRERLRNSIPWLAETFSTLDIRVPERDEWTARPADFGFYYDLASAVHHGTEGDNAAALEAIAARLAERMGQGADQAPAMTHGFRVNNLSSDVYSEAEVDCLLRWLDLEADNRMALVPLSDTELDDDTARLMRALEFIEEAAPGFYGELQALTTEFIMAKPGPDAMLSFGGASSFALWGAVALNGRAHPNWFDYVPRVVHEYSHNLLFGIAAEQELVQNDPSERYTSPLRGTPRPVDGIYHACYVSARNVLLMDTLIAALPDLKTGEEEDSLIALMRASSQEAEEAYDDCMEVLNAHAKLTDLGAAVLADASDYMGTRQLD